MKIPDVRKILLLHALETSEDGEIAFSDSEKTRAASDAGAPLVKSADTRRQDVFLADRADALLEVISPKHGIIEEKLSGDLTGKRFGIFAAAIFVLAVIIGFLTNELGPEKRINILAFPLLGILLWNLIVYVRELWLVFCPMDKLFSGGPLNWISEFFVRAGKSISVEEDEVGSGIQLAIRKFEAEWNRLILPLWGSRTKVVLHVTAILLAGSAIAGMYVNGLANEYLAVWESTFFSDGEQLQPFLNTVLGPASAISGDPLPDASALNKIRWTSENGTGTTGENAARWIHWYAITIGIFILIPRLVFAAIWQVRSISYSNRIPYQQVDSRYFDHLLSVSTGTSKELKLVSYAHRATGESQVKIHRALEDWYQRPVVITSSEFLEFGDEDDAKEKIPRDREGVLLLLNFAATPERETHLSVIRAFLEEDEEGPVTVLLDADSFDRKNSSFSDGEERKEERLNSWRALTSEVDCELIVVPGLKQKL